MTSSESADVHSSPAPAPGTVDSRTGWVVAAAAFLATFSVFGVAYSFGAMFVEIRAEFGASKTLTAALFSVTTALYFVLGIWTGRTADRRGPRVVLILGALSMGAGLLLTAAAPNIWVAILTYGTGVGMGVACGYVPMVATVGGWFDRHRTTALGIAVSGIGMGTLVFAPVADALTEAHGWRTTYVVLAFVTTATLLGAATIAHRPPVGAAAAAPVAFRELLRQRRFLMLYIGMLLTSLTLFVPFVFLDDYLTERDSSAGPLLIGIIGATSVVGRLGLGALATRVPLSVMYLTACGIVPLSFLLWLGAGTNTALLVVFAVVMGVSYGGFIALAPAVTAQLFGTEGLGGVLGALYTSAGFGGLIGPPLAGVLESSFGYTAMLLAAVGVGLSALPVLATVTGRSAA